MIEALMGTDTSLALMQASQAKTASLSQTANLKKIDEAAKEFEAVFISEMLKPMFDGIETDGLFGGGKGEEVFRSVMLQEYGKVIARTDRVGLADHIKSEMIRMQEMSQSKNNKVS